jgi:phosphate transport system protein
VADKAVNIAKQARKMVEAPDAEEREIFEPIFREALTLLGDAMKSYQAGDVKLALAIKARDKSLDHLSSEAARRVTEKMAQNPDRIKDCVSLLFVSRHLERVGDHAKNIAEDTVYAAAAEDIRHPNVESTASGPRAQFRQSHEP